MSAAVDASVVIAWQSPDHVFHAEAIQLIGGTEPPLYLNELNLAEVLVGISKDTWPSAIETLREMGFRFVTTSATELAAARVDTGLRMPDACVIATARSTGSTTVLTFDSALTRAAVSLGLVTEIAEAEA